MTDTSLQVFNNEDFGEIRASITEDGNLMCVSHYVRMPTQMRQ